MGYLPYLDFTDENYMNNILIGPQVVRAIADVSFTAANMVAGNTNAIYLIDASGYHSFNPNDGSIAQINSFVNGKSYLVNSKIDRDLTTYLYSSQAGGNNLTSNGQNVTSNGDQITVSDQ